MAGENNEVMCPRFHCFVPGCRLNHRSGNQKYTEDNAWNLIKEAGAEKDYWERLAKLKENE